MISTLERYIRLGHPAMQTAISCRQVLRSLLRLLPLGEEGQAVVEYGLLLSLLSMAAVAALTLIGPNLQDYYQHVIDALASTDPSSGSILLGHHHGPACPVTSNGLPCRPGP